MSSVSIPFIAGQWSLRNANGSPPPPRAVSIPFIAGQWSLPARAEAEERACSSFQSPSLRGSGRFGVCEWRYDLHSRCFNPLHCGAVVASMPPAPGKRRRGRGFNPLHCGAVVASEGHPYAYDLIKVCFNPLHCGAVVASAVLAAWRAEARASFNPLHCGAVVASSSPR